MPDWIISLQQWFVRPAWLLLLPVVLIVGALTAQRSRWGGWRRFIARRHLPYLVTAPGAQGWRWRPIAVLTAMLLAVLALAGPSWQAHSDNGFKSQHSLVVLFDLSDSMLAWDLPPSRLAQAKLKLTDLLRRRRDGETGLLAYAGDAFQVAPLTDDPDTVIELFNTLQPDVMPAPGSNTEAAVQRGIDMIRRAGRIGGDLLLITDGVTSDAVDTIVPTMPAGFRLSVLAVATRQAVAVPARGGDFVRHPDGQPVMITTDHQRLASLASATGGRYTELTISDQDITRLESGWRLSTLRDRASGINTNNNAQTDQRSDGGWLFVLLLLPLAALAFRRGELFVLLLVAGTPLPSHAASWQDWWLTPDQQAARLLKNGRPDLAADRFVDAEWAAIASFRSKQLDRAANGFTALTGNDTRATAALFNLANTVLVQGRLAVAIDLYERVLARQPEHNGAAHNLALAKATLARLEKEREQQQERDRRRQAVVAPNGEDAANQGNTQQSQQVGGASTDGDTQGDEALQDSGAASSQSAQQQAADERQNPGEPADTKSADALPVSAAAEQGGNATLNPYSEQWLRNQQTDPGYMLRRKLQFQAKQRSALPADNKPRRY